MRRAFIPAFFKTEQGIIMSGEGTSYTSSWIASALESGIRAATQVLLELGLVDVGIFASKSLSQLERTDANDFCSTLTRKRKLSSKSGWRGGLTCRNTPRCQFRRIMLLFVSSDLDKYIRLKEPNCLGFKLLGGLTLPKDLDPGT